MSERTTWREILNETLAEGEEIIAYAPDEAAFDVEFDAGYGSSQGPPVLAWSADYVYFPITYDGSESLGFAPRNPRAEGPGALGRGVTGSRRMSVLATALGVSFNDLQQVVNQLAADHGVAWALIAEDDTPLLETVSGIYQDQALTDAAIVEVAQRLGGTA